MRGAEHPANVSWTHPFLPPLKPLPSTAARRTFIDITEDSHNPSDIDKVLNLTDNMPLAVNLIAHLVDYEGCHSVLTRWPTEKTALLSEGYDRQSNLDLSISFSLSSPRVTLDAKELLTLLSILPNGLSDDELVQSNLHVRDPLQCKANLLSTSLAYVDDEKRLKLYLPIREYIKHGFPPGPGLVSVAARLVPVNTLSAVTSLHQQADHHVAVDDYSVPLDNHLVEDYYIPAALPTPSCSYIDPQASPSSVDPEALTSIST